MSEKQKPHLLNRILRCSACAKKLFYGILITVGFSTTILFFAVMEIPVNPHYVTFGIVLGMIIAIYIGLSVGAYKGFKAYCDRTNLYYDDFIVAGMALGCSFGIFLLSLGLYLDQGNSFEFILHNAVGWDLENVQ